MQDDKFTNWRKSRYSSGATGNCVEVATATSWRKSSRSDSSGNCVEVAAVERVVGVRDSKQHGRGPILEFAAAHWETFLRKAKSGEFDL